MKNNIFKKNHIIFSDFMSATEKEDKIELSLFFIFFLLAPMLLPQITIKKSDDFVSALITVAALFISFTLTYIALLYSGDNSSLNDLKKNFENNKTIEGKAISLYHILHSQIIFLLNIEVIFLIFLLIIKLLIYFDYNLPKNLSIGIPLSFLSIIIYLLIINVRNMYLTFFSRDW